MNRISDGKELMNVVVALILQSPDEVWSNRVNGKLTTFYIKYYEGEITSNSIPAYVIAVNGTVAESFYQIKDEIRLTDIRKGILAYVK